MHIAWHPKRWWNFCMSEDEKKKRNRTDFYWGIVKVCVGSMGVLKHFEPKIYNDFELYQVCMYV